MEIKLSISEIIKSLGEDVYKVLGPKEGFVTRVGSIDNASAENLTFCSYSKQEFLAITPISEEKALKLINQTGSRVVICSKDLDPDKLPKDKTFIMVENPKLGFVKVFNEFFSEKPEPFIHPTAVIHPKAKLHESVYIGPLCHIGECEIGERSVIKGGVYIYDNVKIGKNVTVHAGCVIGADGFGWVWNKEEELLKFPQIGNVIIEDSVELQANTHIARGALDSTFIGKGTKIDALCHIAHNVQIGKHCFIAANTTIGGGVKIGDNSWLGITTNIKQKTKLGDHVTTGMSTVITKDVPPGTRMIGSPGRPAEEFKKMLEFLKRQLS